MKILKPQGEEFIFDNKKRRLLFNINTINEIQEHFDMYIVDVLNALVNPENADRDWYNKLAYILTVLLNEDIRLHNEDCPNDKWEEISIEFVKSRVITNKNSGLIAISIIKAFSADIPESEEEDDPNLMSGQTTKSILPASSMFQKFYSVFRKKKPGE